jgi:hypothetical protein
MGDAMQRRTMLILAGLVLFSIVMGIGIAWKISDVGHPYADIGPAGSVTPTLTPSQIASLSASYGTTGSASATGSATATGSASVKDKSSETTKSDSKP